MTGKVAIKFDDALIGKIEAFAGRGMSYEQISRSLGFSARTLKRSRERDDRVAEAIKNGKAKGIATITNALFDAAKGGNITAMIFFLKNQAQEQWKDRLPEAPPEDLPAPQKVEVTRIDGRRAANE